MQEQQNENTVQQEELSQQELSEVLQIRRDKLDALKQAGKNPYEITTYDRNAFTSDIVENFEQMEGKRVKIAGRIMGWRDMGKANFIDIRDAKGRIQVYVRVNDIGEENYADFKTWDIGDIIGVEGDVFKTRRGEIPLHAYGVKLLSKSLLPLPEKFHGLTNTDLRYRQRYVDLIVNPEVKETFIKRSQILKEVAQLSGFNLGYLEVDTPVLHTLEIGASARPFANPPQHAGH